MLLRFIFGSLLPFFLIGTSHAAIGIAEFTTATNNRFTNDPAFIGSGFDLSGVTISNGGRWITMISENVFVTANHYYPAVGSSVTFYGSNDPNGPSATHTVGANSLRIGSTDIYLGTLTTPLGVGYTFYDFATENVTNTNTGIYADAGSWINSPYYMAEAYVFGRSQSAFPVSQDVAVGRNVLNAFGWISVSGAGSGLTIEAAVDASGTDNYVTYETNLRVGDSGAPLFVDDGTGNLTIVGTNWYSQDGVRHGAAYLGNYSNQIQDFIDLNAVPEPTTYALLLGLTALVAIQRRRRPTPRD